LRVGCAERKLDGGIHGSDSLLNPPLGGLIPLAAFADFDDESDRSDSELSRSFSGDARPRRMTDDAVRSSDEHWASDEGEAAAYGSDSEQSDNADAADLNSGSELSDSDDPAENDGMLPDSTPASRNHLLDISDSSDSEAAGSNDVLPEPLSAASVAIANQAKERELTVLRALASKMAGEEFWLEAFARSVSLSVKAVRRALKRLDLLNFIDDSGGRVRYADPVRVTNLLNAREPGANADPLGKVLHLGRWRSVKSLTARRILPNGTLQGHVKLSSHHHAAIWLDLESFDAVGKSAVVALINPPVEPSKTKPPRKRKKNISQRSVKRQNARNRKSYQSSKQRARAAQTEEEREVFRDIDAERKRQLREKNKAKRKKQLLFPKDAVIGTKAEAVEKVGMWDAEAEQEYKAGAADRANFLADTGEGNWADCLMKFRKLMEIGNIRFCACCSEMHAESEGKRFSLNSGNEKATCPLIPGGLLAGMQAKLINNRRNDDEIQHPLNPDRLGLQRLRDDTREAKDLVLCWRRFLTAAGDAKEVEAGICEETEEIQLCNRCIDPLRRNPPLMPARAMANNLSYLPVPIQLKDLRVTERNAVSGARAALWIVNLERHDIVNTRAPSAGRQADKHHKFKRGAIILPQDVLSVAASLPPPPDDLSDMLFVNFLKSSDAHTDEVQLEDCVGVRYSKVKAALEYMVANPTVKKVLVRWIFVSDFVSV
jgi:hypothetical protein